MKTPHERYQSDPQFRLFVDLLTNQIVECRYSPSEIRDAAMLAAIHYETIHARPVYLKSQHGLERVDGYHGKEEDSPTDNAPRLDRIEERISAMERWIERHEDYAREQNERS